MGFFDIFKTKSKKESEVIINNELNSKVEEINDNVSRDVEYHKP